MEDLLLIPGPTQVPPRVRRAMDRPMINHRGPGFYALYDEVQAGLKPVFGVEEDLLVFPSAGTGMLEAAVVNLLSPGDRVLAAIMGDFGDRFARIAQAFGVAVDRLDVEWGTAIPPALLAGRLRAGEYRAVLVTHNETSTGVTNDLAALSKVIHEAGALMLVDSVSGLAGAEVRVDEWGIDLLVTASQKALMTPPGLGFAALRRETWAAVEAARCPRAYWDFRQARKSAEKKETPYTPAVSLWYGVAEAARMIAEEGLPAVYRRHFLMRDMLRAGAQAIGLRPLVADEAIASPTVSAFLLPEGVSFKDLGEALLAERVVVAGGQGHLNGKIFRIGHMGAAQPDQMLVALSALERVLPRLGHQLAPGAGVAAARGVWEASL